MVLEMSRKNKRWKVAEAEEIYGQIFCAWQPNGAFVALTLISGIYKLRSIEAKNFRIFFYISL